MECMTLKIEEICKDLAHTVHIIHNIVKVEEIRCIHNLMDDMVKEKVGCTMGEDQYRILIGDGMIQFKCFDYFG